MHCPYCRTEMVEWPGTRRLEPCFICQRPMVLLRSIRHWHGPLRLYGLFELGWLAYMAAMIGMTGMALASFIDILSYLRLTGILLFVIGSILCADGILGITTGVDKTGSRMHRDRIAKALGFVKIGTGLAALLLTAIGIGL